MIWPEDVLAFLEITVWPTVVLIAIFVFRRDLKLLVGRISEISGHGWKGKFDSQELDKASSEIASTSDPNTDGNNTTLELSKSVMSLLSLAKTHPTAAVLEAFRQLETEARSALEDKGLSEEYKAQSLYRMIGQNLSRSKILSPREIEVFHSLRKLRNSAAHSREANITVGQAEEFVLVSDKLMQRLIARSS